MKGKLCHLPKAVGRLLPVVVAVVVTVGILAVGRAQAGQPMVYRLKWVFNTSVVGDLYARDMGMFTDAGLQVEVKAGGPERDAIREIELGAADFGVASADQVIRALAKGARLKVVAQLFQANPLQWVYRPDKVTIHALGDLAGKTIGVTFGKNDEFIMRTLLAKAGLTEGKVHLYSVRLDFTPFFKGKVDLWPVYRNTQGILLADRLAKEGEPLAFFDPGRFGVRFVANSVITSAEAVANRPEQVRRFVTALMAGWRAALDPANETHALAVLRKADPHTPDAVRKAQLAATRKLVLPAAGRPLGWIDADGWRQTEAILLEHGQIEHPVEVQHALEGRFVAP